METLEFYVIFPLDIQRYFAILMQKVDNYDF